MRCATCGTENAPDSRFCGGCGGRVAAAGNLARTQKVVDDGAAPQVRSPSVPPERATSAPEIGRRPVSIPPQPAAVRPPLDPSMSMASAPSGTRWGLILFVLLIDIGFAVAGGVLLNESRRPAPSTTATDRSSEATMRVEAPAPAGSITAIPASTPSSEAGSASPSAPALDRGADVTLAAGSGVTPPPDPVTKQKTKPTKRAAKRGATSAVMPIDPYGDPSPPVPKQ
jgi:hypothetical protein